MQDERTASRRTSDQRALGTDTRHGGDRDGADTAPSPPSHQSADGRRPHGSDMRPPASAADDAYDSGEVEHLPDGSISIPIIEEELIVTKRLIVRERIIVRKDTIVETRRIETELRRERVETEESR